MWISWLWRLPRGHTGACPCTSETHGKVLAGSRASCLQLRKGSKRQQLGHQGTGYTGVLRAASVAFMWIQIYFKTTVSKPKSAKRLLNPSICSQIRRFYAAGQSLDPFLGVIYNCVCYLLSINASIYVQEWVWISFLFYSLYFYMLSKVSTMSMYCFYSLKTTPQNWNFKGMQQHDIL